MRKYYVAQYTITSLFLYFLVGAFINGLECGSTGMWIWFRPWLALFIVFGAATVAVYHATEKAALRQKERELGFVKLSEEEIEIIEAFRTRDK